MGLGYNPYILFNDDKFFSNERYAYWDPFIIKKNCCNTFYKPLPKSKKIFWKSNNKFSDLPQNEKWDIMLTTSIYIHNIDMKTFLNVPASIQ